MNECDIEASDKQSHLISVEYTTFCEKLLKSYYSSFEAQIPFSPLCVCLTSMLTCEKKYVWIAA